MDILTGSHSVNILRIYRYIWKLGHLFNTYSKSGLRHSLKFKGICTLQGESVRTLSMACDHMKTILAAKPHTAAELRIYLRTLP